MLPSDIIWCACARDRLYSLPPQTDAHAYTRACPCSCLPCFFPNSAVWPILDSTFAVASDGAAAAPTKGDLLPHLDRVGDPRAADGSELVSGWQEKVQKMLMDAGAVQGDYDRALETYEEQLGRMIAKRGSSHLDVATIYNNMGSVYFFKGEYEQAVKMYQRSVNMKVALLGKNHPDVASSYNDLQSVYKFLRGSASAAKAGVPSFAPPLAAAVAPAHAPTPPPAHAPTSLPALAKPGVRTQKGSRGKRRRVRAGAGGGGRTQARAAARAAATGVPAGTDSGSGADPRFSAGAGARAGARTQGGVGAGAKAGPRSRAWVRVRGRVGT